MSTTSPYIVATHLYILHQMKHLLCTPCFDFPQTEGAFENYSSWTLPLLKHMYESEKNEYFIYVNHTLEVWGLAGGNSPLTFASNLAAGWLGSASPGKSPNF